VRQQLTLPSALDTGKNSLLHFSVQCPFLSSTPTIHHFSQLPTLINFSLYSPRSPFPLSLQHLQVPPAPECRQQTGAYSRPISCSPSWGLLGRKPCVHGFLCPTGAKTPPWAWPWPWPWPCLTFPGYVPEPTC
jgi:hypothetical protein